MIFALNACLGHQNASRVFGRRQLSFAAFLVSFAFFACKTRVSVEASKANSEIVGIPVKAASDLPKKEYLCNPTDLAADAVKYSSGKSSLFAFHWTDNTSVLQPQGLQTWLSESFESAKTVSLDESGNALGEGLYLSSSPLYSAGLGHILIAIPLKQNCTIVKLNNTDWESSLDDLNILKSSAALVLFNLDSKENKVLVRAASAIQIEMATALDTRTKEGVPLESIGPVAITKSGDWKLAIEHFGASFSFYGAAFSKTKELPLFKNDLANSPLTNEGWMLALQAELSSGGETRERSLDKAVSENLAVAKVCSRVETRLTYRGSKYRTCLVELFEFLAAHLSPQLASDLDSISMDFDEAKIVLSAFGYGNMLPNSKSNTESQTKEQIQSLLSVFLSNWQAVPGKSAAALSLMRASQFFASGETEKDLDSL